MAFDVSSITSAVNKYLYSISDVNKLLTQGTSSSATGEGANSSTGANSELAGIFKKYLTGAINNAATASGAGNLNSNEIASAMLSLSNGVTVDRTAIDKLSAQDNMTDLEVSKALSTLKGLSTGMDTGSSNSSNSSSESTRGAFSNREQKAYLLGADGLSSPCISSTGPKYLSTTLRMWPNLNFRNTI